MNREELEKKAKELGIEFNDETSDEDLSKLISTKEKEDKSKNAEWLDAELKKVIKQRDDAKSDKRKLQSQLTDLEKKISELPDKTTLESLKSEYDELKTFKTEIEKQKEEEELKNKTELERAQVQFNKQIKELESKYTSEIESYKVKLNEYNETLNQHKGLLGKLRETSLEKELLASAAKHKAYNPEQIVRMTKSDFQYDDKLDTWVHFVKDEKGKIIDELKPSDYIKNFLEKEDNSNLVSSSVNTGGTGHRTITLKENKVKIRENSKYDPNDVKIKRDAEVRGLEVEEYISFMERMDAKKAGGNKE